MSPRPPLTVLVVAHTHWDREWYHTAERFRQRLVGLVDDLLDDPPAQGSSFLLDGQGVVLDDYLAVRPERAAELSALLREGRIEAGPWYVLADELIPSGEALVRNLLEGRATVRRLRGEPPPVLYCPDSFGHPAILPELAAGFGCDLVVLWRGYGGARWPAGDTVRWAGPTGATVVLHHLPPDGYEFGSALATAPADVESRWQRIEATLAPRATTGAVLLLNGADHHARQREQASAVALLAAAAAAADVDANVRPASLADAARTIAKSASAIDLPTVAGELRDSYGYTWTLGGTLATRAAQKRRNAIAERTLVRDVEPWIAVGDAGGGSGTRALLRAAWRELLLAHPHDTLCGTSIDAVAEAFEHRLSTVESQLDGLRSDALARLLEHDAESARHRQGEWQPALMIRNPVARTRSGVADVVLVETIADVAVGPGSATRQGARAALDDRPQETATYQVLDGREVVALTESSHAYPDADLVRETRALVWVDAIGGYTVQTSRPSAPTAATAPRAVVVDERSLDNGLLRAVVDAGGAVRLEEAASGRIVTDLLRLERQRDVGDLYTPAIRESLDAPRVVSCSATHRGPLRGELTLQVAGGDAMMIRLRLDAGLAALGVEVEGVNTIENARLRLRVAGDLAGPGGAIRAGAGQGGDAGAGTGVDSAFGGAPRAAPQTSDAYATIPITTIADAAFHPVAREPLAVLPSDEAMEHVVRTAPLHRFVSRYAADRGLTLVSDGLAEYEALRDGGIAVTLVRAVGELSRHDLPERPGHAGWPAATPGAQCAGPFAARFAVALHGPDTPAQRDAIERLSEDVLLPITGTTLRSYLGGTTVAGGLELAGDGLAFSAAMPAREPGSIVLRCVNRRCQPVQGTWRLGQRVQTAHLARLDETPGERLVVDGGMISFTAESMEIVTILAVLANSGRAETAGF